MRRFATIFSVVGLLALVGPAFAAEPVGALPATKQPASSRIDGVFVVNQRIVQYVQAEQAADRFHAVFVNIESGLMEVVTIGNRVYFRRNQETRWKSTTLDQALKDNIPGAIAGQDQIPQENVTIVRVGDADVNQMPTTQYQVLLDVTKLPPGSELEAYKADAFIGKSDNYLHKLQFTVRSPDAQAGPVEVIGLNVYSAFDTPVAIGAPPDSLVEPMGARDVLQDFRFPGAAVVPLWARPAVGESLVVP